MKRRNLCFLFLVVLSCSKPPDAPKDEPKQDWIFQFPGTASLSSTDLDPIRTTIGEKRVVMMGEAIRGTGDLARVRERLIHNLHEGGDFNLLLFEGSPIEFWIAEEEYFSTKRGVNSSGDFQRTALPGVWQTEEVRSVLEYALSSQAGVGSSDLYLSSYGVQIGLGQRFSQGKSVFEALTGLLQNRDKRISHAEQEAIAALDSLVSCKEKKFPDSEEHYAQAEQGISVLSQVVARTARDSSKDLHEKALTLLPKAASYSLEFCREANENTRNYNEVRDEWASKLFTDLFSTLNQKAFVWAQSAQIRQSQRKEGRMSFGAYARGAFPDEIFSIHFTAGSGRAIAFTNEKGKAIEPTEKLLLPVEKVSLERKLSALSAMDFFIAAKSLPGGFAAEETTRSEPEGLTTIDPRKDFDGYYFVQTVSSPALRR